VTRRGAALRFGIVGAGGAAQLHAAALSRIEGARLVAVAARGRERAHALARRYEAAVECDADTLLARRDLDAVVLCTPHPLHRDGAIAAALAGLHVVVEKPLALAPDDCDAIIEAARAASVTLSVISQRRWYEPVRRVKDAIDGGRIGEPGLAVVQVLGWRGPEYYAMDDWRGTKEGEGGGVLVNQAVHQLDLLCWYLGSVVEVDAMAANLNHPDIDVEDTAVAHARFANGALASIVASNSQRPGLWARVHVHGRSGASVGVETDRGSPFVAGVSVPSYARNDLWTIPGEENGPARWETEDRERLADVDIASHYHEQQLRDIVGAIRTGREPAVRGEDAREAVVLIDAIYRAHATGARIAVAAPAPTGS
jgi:predicted dehydrogenase